MRNLAQNVLRINYHGRKLANGRWEPGTERHPTCQPGYREVYYADRQSYCTVSDIGLKQRTAG